MARVRGLQKRFKNRRNLILCVVFIWFYHLNCVEMSMKIAYRSYRMCCPSHASKCIPKSHNSNGRVPRISRTKHLVGWINLEETHDVTAISGTHADPRTSWSLVPDSPSQGTTCRRFSQSDRLSTHWSKEIR